MKNLHLLLIDDSETDYEIIKYKLSSISTFNFELDWEESYKEGKKKVNDSIYDLILLDTNLSDGNGLDLLKYARESKNTKPIIIITGVSDRENDMRALADGADDYIVKTDLANTDTSLERSLRYCYERYLTRLKISQREERYRNLFEKSLDAITIVNADFEFYEVNQSMLSLFETNLEGLIGSSLGNLFSEQEEFFNFTELVHKWGLVKKHKSNFVSTNGKKIIGEITSIVLFNLQNKISGYQLIIKDLTTEKLNEQRIIRAEKLGMTGRIARSIAHEVRNPLTNINLAVEQLKEDIPQTESNDMYVDIINRNSHRINKLITELLNSSKPTRMEPVKQSVKDVVEEAISLALDRINLHGIELTTSIEEDHETSFDQVQLKTALLNIIINAIEAMEEKKGKLFIEIGSSLSEVLIKIADNGVGMKPEILNQLFDPFFTGKQTGMGLGLTSTQNIILQHNGNIDVESEVGKGTTFTINLPKT